MHISKNNEKQEWENWRNNLLLMLCRGSRLLAVT